MVPERTFSIIKPDAVERNLDNEITLDESVRVKALKPLNRMLEIV